jgi:hypothetical protein
MPQKHSILEKAENRLLFDVGIRFLMYVFWFAFVAAMFSIFHHPYIMWATMGTGVLLIGISFLKHIH